jgi:ferredoxin
MRYIEHVVTLEFDAGRCSNCGMCTAVCPHGVFANVDGHIALVDRGACMECGACARNCPAEAIAVRSGVGCASGVLAGLFSGGAPVCGCGEGPAACG